MRQILVLFFILSSFFCLSALAEDEKAPPPALEKADFTALKVMNPVHVEQIIDGLRVRLKDNRIIQLSGIEVPDMDNLDPSETAVQAKEMLTEMLEGKEVRLYQTKTNDKGRTNRMGYDLGHLERKDGDIWIQGFLLAHGLARALPSKRNPEMTAQMYKAEQQARLEKRGIWDKEDYKVRDAAQTDMPAGKFLLIEGTIYSTATMNNRIYLNFGADWRTDFTISIETHVRRDLVKAGIDPMQLAHKKIRVRGWLENWNGPHIKLEHYSHLEVLPDAS